MGPNFLAQFRGPPALMRQAVQIELHCSTRIIHVAQDLGTALRLTSELRKRHPKAKITLVVENCEVM